MVWIGLTAGFVIGVWLGYWLAFPKQPSLIESIDKVAFTETAKAEKTWNPAWDHLEQVTKRKTSNAERNALKKDQDRERVSRETNRTL